MSGNRELKLWVLRPVGWPDNHDTNVFNYDCNHGFVVRADSAASARKVAAMKTADEGEFEHSPWCDNTRTSCRELNTRGTTTIIMQDFHAG